MPDSPIDDVLEALRAALLARRGEAAERVARIKTAADAYLRAVEQDIAGQFAVRNGLESAPPGSQTVRAALDLRAAVDALPEVRVRPAAHTPTGLTVPPGRPSVPPAAELRVGREGGASDTPLGQAADEFVREVRGANLDEMPTDLFRVHVEEYAARARYLQEVFADRPADVEAIGRVIRTLTAMVAKRGLTGIYGLSRSHSGDWQARADEAARKRLRLLSIPPNPPPRISPRADDLAPQETERVGDEGDEGDDEPAGPAPAFVHLRASNASAPLVIVGGVAKPEKVERLRRRFDLSVEWVALDGGGTQPVAALERRVREGRLAGLVLLQDLMAHKHAEPLVSAAQKGGVPWAYGDRAGKASLERALGEIDAMLAQRA